MSFSFFVLGFLVGPNVLWWVWADRRLRGRPRFRTALAVFMAPQVAMVAWIMLHPETARNAHAFLPEWWMVLTYVWHLLVMPFVLVSLLLLGLFRLGCSVRTAISSKSPAEPEPQEPDEQDTVKHRRPFLKAAVAAVPPLAAGLGMLASFPRLHSFASRTLEVPLSALPPALDGLSIAHVSDLHYGKYTDPAMVDRLVDAINAMRADLVLMTGDLIDLSLDDLPAALAFVNRLDPRGGLFLCEGNHDLIHDGAAFAHDVRAAGISLLRDESATVLVRGEQVQVLGVRWARAERSRAQWTGKLNEQRDPAAFPILLAHHPHCFDSALDIPLTLAGHTHGGQLMLNERLGAGPVMFRYWSGLYGDQKRALVVSNGAGNWFPLRTAAPAEVTRVVLRSVL